MKYPGIFERRMAKHNPGGHNDFVSRDYAEIDCRATGCMWNRKEKCMVPGLAKIDPEGKCSGFKVAPQKRGLDGD